MSVNYPELRTLLRPEFQRFRAVSGKPLAMALSVGPEKLSPNTVMSWRNGTRSPSPEHRDLLAAILYPEMPARQVFRNRLETAIKRRVSSIGVLEELATESRPIKVGTTSQTDQEEFLDFFFARLLNVAGVRKEIVQGKQDYVSVKEQLLRREIDVGLGLFATIDRALTIRFFPTPIKVGLNAVVLKRHLHTQKLTIARLRESLKLRGKHRDEIFPVVAKQDVGWIFITKSLEFREPNVGYVNRIDPKEYANQLMHLNVIRGVPAAVVDEITALKILATLQKRGEPALLMYPLNNESSVQHDKIELPEYLLSISVARKNTDLSDYLSDALRLFLQTEVHSIASMYTAMARELQDLVLAHYPSQKARSSASGRRELQAIASEWVKYTFRLSQDYLDVYHDVDLRWLPILKRSLAEYKTTPGWRE